MQYYKKKKEPSAISLVKKEIEQLKDSRKLGNVKETSDANKKRNLVDKPKICFVEDYVLFKHLNLYSEKLFVKGALKDFNKFIDELDFIQNLEFKIFTNEKMLFIDDKEGVCEMFRRLVDILLIEYKVRFKNQDFKLDLFLNKEFSSIYINLFTKQNEHYKRECLQYLFQEFDAVLYIPEIIVNNMQQIIKREPSFLFIRVSNNSDKINILWESLKAFKATYIFEVLGYIDFVIMQRDILSFISSTEFLNKRYYLQHSSDLRKKLNYKSTIKHIVTERFDDTDDFYKWQSRLIKKISC